MNIQLAVCFFSFLSVAACQQDSSYTRPVAGADLGATTLATCEPAREDARPVAQAGAGYEAIAAGLRDLATTSKAPAGIVLKSMDGGQTWQDVSNGLPEGLEVQGVHAIGNEIFLGCGDGLYRSTTTAPVWQKDLLLSGRIVAVVRGRAGLYACSYGRGLFQNLPGTDIWKNVSSTLKEKLIRSVCETPDGAILVGTDNGIYKSADGGHTWKQVCTENIVLNIVESGSVLIAGAEHGVLRSTDGGERWEYTLNENILAKRTALLHDRFVTILGTRDPSKACPGGITSRLRASDDGGKTWKRLEQSLLPLPGAIEMDGRLATVRDVFDIIQVDEHLFCSFNTGIYRSTDQGATWELVLPSKGGFNLSVCGKALYITAIGGC